MTKLEKLNGVFIKCLSLEHGQQIKQFFESCGVDNPFWFRFDLINNYYGIENGKTSNYFEYQLENKRKLTLEEAKKLVENEYPKIMMVSDYPIISENKGQQRVVFMEKLGKYIAWANAKTFEDAEKQVDCSGWRYAKDIEEEPIIELTIQQIAKKFNISSDKIRIKE